MASPKWYSVILRETGEKIFFPIPSERVVVTTYEKLPSSIKQGVLASVKCWINFEQIYQYYQQLDPSLCVKELVDILKLEKCKTS